jgi:hypothetical protein
MATLQNIDPNLLKSISESIQAQFNNLQKALEPLQEALQEFVKALKEVPESTKVLAEYGWYLPFDFHPPTIKHYVEEIKKGNITFIDNEMITLLDNEITNIESELIKKFSNRKSVIQAAIKAHRNHDYYLSIPVFFSQVDGICNELTGDRFFKIRHNRPSTGSWTSNLKNDSILELVLEPLKHTGVARQKQDLSNPLGTNRHDVMHGDSVDYGEDKTNSYKALSLLNYIGETVYMAKEYIDEKEKKTHHNNG